MKEAIKLSIICLLSIAIIALPFLGLAAFVISLIYYLFFFLPVLPWIDMIKANLLEKFILTNLAGLSYLIIAALLDSALKIKLTQITFTVIPLIIFIAGIKYTNLKGDKK